MSGGLHSLATIIKRLEATTSRLEDLSTSWDAAVAKQSPGDIKSEPKPVDHAPGSTSFPPPSQAATPILPSEDFPSVIAFDQRVIEGKLAPFLALTRSFAIPPVIEQAELFQKELLDLRALLKVAAACKQPDQTVLGELLAPLLTDIEAIARLREANRKERDWSNHMIVLAEGAPSVGWVTVQPKPGPYVKEISDSTMFYGNRIIKEFKEKDVKHAQWIKAYTALLEEMRLYVMDHHTTGLAWNPKGLSVVEYRVSSVSTTPAVSGPPPPPPPPPHVVVSPQSTASNAPPVSGVAAVFADLNRGEDVTKGLRKVDKSEMTHKNPSLRLGSIVSSQTGSNTAAKKPVKPTKPQSLMSKKPSKFALESNKWVIEYQENETGLIVENGQINQIVNLFNCKNSTLVIKGKVNAVTIANCKKMSVLIDSVISSVSITNSPSFALQIIGKAPTIQLDSTDSGQIYLSKDCAGIEITSAKCSSINVSLPVEGEEDGVFKESPIPEMLKTVVSNGKLTTTVVEHVG